MKKRQEGVFLVSCVSEKRSQPAPRLAIFILPGVVHQGTRPMSKKSGRIPWVHPFKQRATGF